MKILGLVALASGAIATSLAQDTKPVTIENFARAESDLYFGNAVKDSGGLANLVIIAR